MKTLWDRHQGLVKVSLGTAGEKCKNPSETRFSASSHEAIFAF